MAKRNQKRKKGHGPRKKGKRRACGHDWEAERRLRIVSNDLAFARLVALSYEEA